MKLYNYLRVLGAFTNSYQLIPLPKDSGDRQERKMLEAAQELVSKAWERRMSRLEAREAPSGDAVDWAAEKAAFFPAEQDGKVLMPLQFVQDYMVRRIAAVQTNASIHSADQVKDLLEVFGDYSVQTCQSFKGLEFARIGWAAKPGQKPKLLVHAKEPESGEDVCIRFEAVGEQAQKFLMAMQALGLSEGALFDLAVNAEDPAIERNRKAGKKVVEPGRFVNHNLTLTVGAVSHTGHPPKGERFIQKPTLEYMEGLYQKALRANERKAA